MMYPDSGDSRPIQIHATPNCTSSFTEYRRTALADEKT